jgi:hypothetical protein
MRFVSGCHAIITRRLSPSSYFSTPRKNSICAFLPRSEYRQPVESEFQGFPQVSARHHSATTIGHLSMLYIHCCACVV